MSQPVAYVRGFSFTNWQTVNPSKPLPGDKMDIELNAIQQTTAQIRGNLALIQRDDGQLANLSVGAEQLKTSISFGINSAATWASGRAYAIRDGVWINNKLYICLVGHTSTVFATDLAAGRWGLILDFDPYVSGAAASASTASAAATAAAASYDSFDDRYLGAKSADPTLDNDGNALLTGALYFNTSANKMKVYNGSVWADVQNPVTRTTYRYIATGGQTVFTGADANALTLSYTVGTSFVTVYQQGLRKAENTYTAATGTSVTLGSGATVSDVILIEVLSPVAGVGTIAAQNSNNVAITGGSISGTTIRNYNMCIRYSGVVSALTDASVILSMPVAATLNAWKYKCSAGSAAVTLKKNASTITGASAVTVNSTGGSANLTVNNVFAIADSLKITIASISSATDIELWLDVTWPPS